MARGFLGGAIAAVVILIGYALRDRFGVDLSSPLLLLAAAVLLVLAVVLEMRHRRGKAQ